MLCFVNKDGEDPLRIDQQSRNRGQKQLSTKPTKIGYEKLGVGLVTEKRKKCPLTLGGGEGTGFHSVSF